jgi:uncharacterized protein DUF4154
MGVLIRSLRSLLVLAVAALPAMAPAQQAPEASIKAAFLFKFAGYVEWPPGAFAGPEAPFVIGVAGAEEVASELERLVPGRTVNNRAVAVRRLREGESPRGAHLVFVGRGEANARAAIRAAQQQGALTVTEGERGLESGSSINFVLADDRVGFEVSLESAERSGLRISSRMLAVARRVVGRS